MGHIIIDIEEPSNEVSHDNHLCSNGITYDDNSIILKELAVEVYQNGFLAGYVFADVNLYEDEKLKEGGDENESYLNEVEKFICQQYLEMVNQIEKTLNRVLKVWEVVQYSIKDIIKRDGREYSFLCQDVDQIFMVLLNIYKQISPCVELKSIKPTKDGVKPKDEDLRDKVRKEIRELIQHCFVLNDIWNKNNRMEIICLSKSLPRMCQIPITFEVTSRNTTTDVLKESKPFQLVYDKSREVVFAQIW